MECELNVDIAASKLSVYSSYSNNLGWRRQRELTVQSSLPLSHVVCVNYKRLRSHSTGEKGSMACKLRSLLITLFIVESELENFEHL